MNTERYKAAVQRLNDDNITIPKKVFEKTLRTYIEIPVYPSFLPLYCDRCGSDRYGWPYTCHMLRICRDCGGKVIEYKTMPWRVHMERGRKSYLNSFMEFTSIQMFRKYNTTNKNKSRQIMHDLFMKYYKGTYEEAETELLTALGISRD